MKREFKVGDRVAVYDAALELFGSPATVQGLLPEGRLYAKLDQPNQLADTPRLHSKQCRRLVKKQRREWWIATHPCSRPSVHSQYKPEMVCGSGCKIEWYRVREVKESQ